MIVRSIFLRRALSVGLAGMALFLFACQSGRKLSPKVAENRAGPFFVAQKCQENGNFRQALIQYQLFLKQAPKDKRSPLALQRMSEIYLKQKEPEKALASLEQLSKTYPDYNWIPEVKYQILVILNQLGKYQASAGNAILWLDRYQSHFLKKDVLVLLGDDFCKIGQAEPAFSCWMEAKRIWKDDPGRERALDEKLKTLIGTAPPTLLSQLLEREGGVPYPPEIYYQISSVFLSQNNPNQAKKAAGALMESTRNLQWISRGEDILARIRKELAICGNCIGCLLPLSGSFAAYGREVLNGISLGMVSIPTEGAKMSLILQDTAGSPEKALAALETLVNKEKVVGIIGPLSSKTAAVVSQKAQELGVPIVTLTQRNDIVEMGDMVFRNFLTPAQEIDSLVQMATVQLGLKRFGILYPDNAYGRFCMNLFWDKLDEVGGSVTAVESYPPNVTDFADPIKKMVGLYYPRDPDWRSIYYKKTAEEGQESEKELKENNPLIDFDAIFIPDTYQRVAMIAPQLAFHDVLGVQLIGTRLWHSPKLLEMAGNYLQGAIFSSGFVTESENPGVMGFIADYKNNFEEVPGILAANGYDTIRLLKTVIAENDPKTRENLRRALIDLPVFQGLTGPFHFDINGEATKRPLLMTVSGNRAIPIN